MSLLLLDIDGLRPDIFSQALRLGQLPAFERLLGGRDGGLSLIIPALAPAPSITFTSQACLFTGQHPSQHGIPGNQLFDRFGRRNDGQARHYAFDVGDTLALDDAVLVFTQGLASQFMQSPTMYDFYARRGWKSVVAGHMYAGGADRWLKPSLVDLARFTKGGNLFRLEAAEFDRKTLDKTLEYLGENGMPDILTVYFMGLDHESHFHGPPAQFDYLSSVLDPYLEELWQAVLYSNSGKLEPPLVAIFSDHGQIAVPADDRHSLRLAFPTEKEMGHLFNALGLDVHDYPGEDPACDAVVASNGGLAHVYLRNRQGAWGEAPVFERDVLPVGRAFWEAHASGKYAPEMEGALAAVLVRNVEKDGWDGLFHALTPQMEIEDLETWFASHRAGEYADPVHRMNNLAGPLCGDVLLVSNYAQGFYFAGVVAGVHGGLHPEDSRALMVFNWPGMSEQAWTEAREAIQAAIQLRCQNEGNRQPSTADLFTGLQAVT